MKTLTGRPRKYEDEFREQIAIEYMTTKKSRRELAEKYHVSISSVNTFLKEYNAKLQEGL